MKLIKLSTISPYFNLAAEEYFLKKDEEPKLILWQNDNTIVIGRNQNTFAEINVSEAEDLGVNVVRRMSGGGAVYHDLGNLNYTFISPSDGKDFLQFKKFTQPVIDLLSSLGVTAELSGRNDILIDGKKISGNAQYVWKNMLLHHGTLMFSTSVDILSKVLNPDKLKIQSKGIASVKSRVTNIGEYTDVKIPEFCDLLFRRTEGEIYTLTEEDIKEITLLQKEKYDTWEWNFGYSPKHSFENSKKLGCGIVSVSVEAKEGKICNIVFSGDFFGRRDVTEFAKDLVGVRQSSKDLLEKLNTTDISEYFAGATAEEITDLLIP